MSNKLHREISSKPQLHKIMNYVGFQGTGGENGPKRKMQMSILSGLQYKVDDNPPWITTFLLGFQVKGLFLYLPDMRCHSFLFY